MKLADWPSLPCNEPVDRSFERGDIDPPLRVFAERARRGDRRAEEPIAASPVQVRDEGSQLPLAEVGVDVVAPKRAEPGIADDVAADDRAAAVAAVGVGEDRFDGPARVRRAAVFVPVGGVALERVPAEVGARRGGDGGVVELLEPVLADVADRDPRRAAGGRCRRRIGTGCAARSCRSRPAPRSSPRTGWRRGSSMACRPRPWGRSGGASRAGRSCSARCSADRLPTRRRRCRSRGGCRGTGAGRRCGWRSRGGGSRSPSGASRRRRWSASGA